MKDINFHNYDIIIVNSSGGKDSLCCVFEVARIAAAQNYSTENIHVSHQDLGRMEWAGTKELAKTQADMFGFAFHVSKYRNKDGETPDLLDYVEKRGKWPSRAARYCTSDFKRGPGARVVTALAKDLGECNVLYVFGFRAEESAARAKKTEFAHNKRLTTKKRTVTDWHPILDWTKFDVWHCIKSNDLPYHPAYDLGMPRLSCAFCIFAPFNALVIAGKENPELLDDYVAMEKKIGHTFKNGAAISLVKDAIENGYEVDRVADWNM